MVRMMRLFISILRTIWDRLRVVLVGVVGLSFLLAWVIFPVPSREDLTEVNGTLLSYSVEPGQSWLAGHHTSSDYVLLKLDGLNGRFWNEALTPYNVSRILPHPGIPLNFYRLSHRSTRLVNGDGQKTWGLTVDGSQIRSLDEAISHDAFLAHVMLPVLGVLALIVAIYLWKKTDTGRRDT